MSDLEWADMLYLQQVSTGIGSSKDHAIPGGNYPDEGSHRAAERLVPISSLIPRIELSHLWPESEVAPRMGFRPLGIGKRP